MPLNSKGIYLKKILFELIVLSWHRRTLNKMNFFVNIFNCTCNWSLEKRKQMSNSIWLGRIQCQVRVAPWHIRWFIWLFEQNLLGLHFPVRSKTHISYLSKCNSYFSSFIYIWNHFWRNCNLLLIISNYITEKNGSSRVIITSYSHKFFIMFSTNLISNVNDCLYFISKFQDRSLN